MLRTKNGSLNTLCLKGYIKGKSKNYINGYELATSDGLYLIYIFKKIDFEFKKEYYFLLNIPDNNEGVIHLFDIVEI